ncbi:hypothetical protein V1511DRAFT_372847 [Dipodascopsis uninucleata]
MATMTETIPQYVESELNFFEPPKDGSKPYNIVYDVPEGTPTKNFGEDTHSVKIADVTGRENEFTLDKNGFQYLKRTHAFKNFSDDASIKQYYYPEVIDAVKGTTGAKKVVIFDHTIRQKNTIRTPVTFVHVDQTPWSAETRVKIHCPEEAEELLKGRFQIINYWKPISGPVEEYPLALGDALDTKFDDIVPVEHRYRDRSGETGSVMFNPNQTFYYKKGMDVDDSVLIKCYDSLPGVAMRTPHTAFKDPTSPENPRPRESIEVRTLVFY